MTTVIWFQEIKKIGGFFMQLTKLFTMQRELDSFIQNNRDEQDGCFSRKRA